MDAQRRPDTRRRRRPLASARPRRRSLQALRRKDRAAPGAHDYQPAVERTSGLLPREGPRRRRRLRVAIVAGTRRNGSPRIDASPPRQASPHALASPHRIRPGPARPRERQGRWPCGANHGRQDSIMATAALTTNIEKLKDLVVDVFLIDPKDFRLDLMR